MRGEFVRGDGLVVPNNITSRGAEKILSRAFSYLDSTAPTFDPTTDLGNYIALGKGVYTPSVAFADLGEPTYGVNGYARPVILRGPTGWTEAQLNGEWYVESIPFTFTPINGPFDKSVNRLILTGAIGISSDSIGTPWAVSSPFPELVMTPQTDVSLRTFKYRLYLR